MIGKNVGKLDNIKTLCLMIFAISLALGLSAAGFEAYIIAAIAATVGALALGGAAICDEIAINAEINEELASISKNTKNKREAEEKLQAVVHQTRAKLPIGILMILSGIVGLVLTLVK